MGNPLSFLLATSLCIGSVYSWRGECFPEEKSAADTVHALCASMVDPIACHDTDGCEWSEAEELTAARARAAETPKALPKSLTAVRVESGRLKKDLAPIEAATEKIGDYVVYKVLMSHMSGEYGAALSAMKSEGDLKITPSSYHPLKEVLAPFQLGRAQSPTETERKSKLNPVQTLLEYSRPFFRSTEPFERSKITQDTLTLNAVVANALTGWIDNYNTNDDRYKGFHWMTKGPNIKNMMLSKPIAEGAYKPVFVPIDQGFARYLTFPWFKWLETSVAALAFLKKQGISKTNYKQLIFADAWLTEKDRDKAGNIWTKNYRQWLFEDPDKAQHFVEDNLAYFGEEVAKSEELKAHIINIVDIVWRSLGQDLCNELHDEIKEIFKKTHKKGHLFTTKSGRSTVLPHLSESKKARQIFETQWNFVVKAMDNQAKACAEWSEKMDEDKDWQSEQWAALGQWMAIKEQLPHRLSLRDYILKKVAPEMDVAAIKSVAEKRRATRRATVALIMTERGSFDESLFEEEGAAGGIRPKARTAAENRYGERFTALEVPYGNGLHWTIDHDDDSRMKQPYASSHSDHNVKPPQYLWMFLMATFIVCGCLAIYSLWCIVNSLLCGIICYAKLISSSRLWPWSTEQRVVCADEDYTSAV